MGAVLRMIKGINRQMIEIVDIKDSYYEKAFLVIRPEYSDYQDKVLQEEARKLIKGFGYPYFARRRIDFFRITEVILSAVIGAGVTAIVFSFMI